MCLGWSSVKLPQHAWHATGAIEVLEFEQAPEETYLWGIPILLAVWTCLVAQVLIKKFYLYAQRRATVQTPPHICSCCVQLPSFSCSQLLWSTRRIHGTQPGASVLRECASAAQALNLSQASTPAMNLGLAAGHASHTDAADGSQSPVAFQAGAADQLQPHMATSGAQPSTSVACSQGTQAATPSQGPVSTTGLTVRQAADLAAPGLHATLLLEQLPTLQQQEESCLSAQRELRTLGMWTYQPIQSSMTRRKQESRRGYVIIESCLMDIGLWMATHRLTLPEPPQRTNVHQCAMLARWRTLWLPAVAIGRQLQAVATHQPITTSTNLAAPAHVAQGLRANSTTAGSSQQLSPQQSSPATDKCLPVAQVAVVTSQPSLLQVQATPLQAIQPHAMVLTPAARAYAATFVVFQQSGSCTHLAALAVPSAQQQLDLVFIDCAAAQQAIKIAVIVRLREMYSPRRARTSNATRAVLQQPNGPIFLAALALTSSRQQEDVVIDCAAARQASKTAQTFTVELPDAGTAAAAVSTVGMASGALAPLLSRLMPAPLAPTLVPAPVPTVDMPALMPPAPTRQPAPITSSSTAALQGSICPYGPGLYVDGDDDVDAPAIDSPPHGPFSQHAMWLFSKVSLDEEQMCKKLSRSQMQQPASCGGNELKAHCHATKPSTGDRVVVQSSKRSFVEDNDSTQ